MNVSDEGEDSANGAAKASYYQQRKSIEQGQSEAEVSRAKVDVGR